MAEIQDGYTMTVKRGQDLLTIQGTDFEKFQANVYAYFGTDAGNVVLNAFRPVGLSEAEAILTKDVPKAPEKKADPEPTAKPITDKQKDFIWKVAKDEGYERNSVMAFAAQVKGAPVSSLNDLTSREASKVIDLLKGKN